MPLTGQDLDQLRVVASVIAAGSFTGAAAARGVSQPAISMQVRQLETRLGVRLIERLGRRVHPTPAARDLLVRLGEVEEVLAAAFDGLEPYRGGVAGRIRFGTGATACVYLLPPVLRRLRERMEGLEIVVRTANTPDILRLVEENDLDLGLVTLPASARALDITPLMADPLVAILPADGPAPERPMSPAELARLPITLYEPGGETRRLIQRWFEAGGVRPRPIMELGSIEAIKRLVGAGLCAAVIPQLALGDGGRDIRALPLAPPLERRLGLALRRDKRLDRGLREMLGLLRALPEAEAVRAHGPAFGP